MAAGTRIESRGVERQLQDIDKRLKKVEGIKPPAGINVRAASSYDEDQMNVIIRTLDKVIKELEKINA